MNFKVPEDLTTNRNGRVLSSDINNSSIGMPDQKFNPWESLSTNDKMRRSSGQSEIFDNNGGTSKADGAGTINKNGEYGPITYGF